MKDFSLIFSWSYVEKDILIFLLLILTILIIFILTYLFVRKELKNGVRIDEIDK